MLMQHPQTIKLYVNEQMVVNFQNKRKRWNKQELNSWKNIKVNF